MFLYSTKEQINIIDTPGHADFGGRGRINDETWLMGLSL
jgi:predicted membrane GTPase involved in stress response